MKPQTESDIQIAIISHLSEIATREDIFFFSPLNETAMMILKMFKIPSNTAAKIVNYLKKMGLVPGVPDLVICGNGNTVFIELKRPGGILSDAQERIHKKIDKAGHPVYTVNKVDIIDDILELEGVVSYGQ